MLYQTTCSMLIAVEPKSVVDTLLCLTSVVMLVSRENEFFLYLLG